MHIGEVGMTLDQLQQGKPARIINVGGDTALRRRLLDMGLTPGTVVEIDRFAPLGDPLELSLRGYHLSLRLGAARDIEVEALP